MAEFVKAAALEDVPPNTAKVAVVNGKEIALFNVDGAFHAIDNACSHQSGPLAEGELEGTVVTCPWHAWEFDVTSGKPATGEGEGVGCYPCRVEGGSVLVAV